MATEITALPYGIGIWRLDSTPVVDDPGAGEFRLDAIAAPTTLAIAEEDRTGVDLEADILTHMVAGDRLLLVQLRNAAKYFAFDVGVPIDQGTWWELPVTLVGYVGSLVDGEDYELVFRHASTETTARVSPPASLVLDDELDELLADVVTALTAEVKADPVRDGDKLDRAARAAVRAVEIHLDYPGGEGDPPVYSTAADVDPQVFDVLVVEAAGYLKRVGFAFGTAGYDEADPSATRAHASTLAALTAGHKSRFGVA